MTQLALLIYFYFIKLGSWDQKAQASSGSPYPWNPTEKGISVKSFKNFEIGPLSLRLPLLSHFVLLQPKKKKITDNSLDPTASSSYPLRQGFRRRSLLLTLSFFSGDLRLLFPQSIRLGFTSCPLFCFFQHLRRTRRTH